LLTGKLAGRDVVFLPRHGRGHRILPSELNHRANLWAMKEARRRVDHQRQPPSVRCRAKYKTVRHRAARPVFSTAPKRDFEHTFFGRGIVGHIAFADPIEEKVAPVAAEDRAVRSRRASMTAARM